MRPLMRKIALGTCVFSTIALSASQALSATLSFFPNITTIDVDDTVNVDVVISGLNRSDVGGFDYVGGFDIDVAYDPSVLDFNSYNLTVNLGDIDLSEAIDFSYGDDGPGTIDLAELSLLGYDDLALIQSDYFILATLAFTGKSAGLSALSFINYGDFYISDEEGNSILTGLSTGSITVTPAAVPEPATMLLLGTGLAGLVGVKRKKKT